MNMALVEEWRAYVAAHKLRVAIIAGFVATHVATNLGMWFHGLGLPDLNFNYLNGLLVFGAATNPELTQDPVMTTFFGMLVHYAQGTIFGLVFAFGIFPLLPISNSLVGNVVKGVIWGAVLATLSAIWWVPALFPNLGGPGVSAGLFLTNFGFEWLVALYLWHFIWGVNLGLFFNPAPAPAMAGREATMAESGGM